MVLSQSFGVVGMTTYCRLFNGTGTLADGFHSGRGKYKKAGWGRQYVQYASTSAEAAKYISFEIVLGPAVSGSS